MEIENGTFLKLSVEIAIITLSNFGLQDQQLAVLRAT